MVHFTDSGCTDGTRNASGSHREGQGCSPTPRVVNLCGHVRVFIIEIVEASEHVYYVIPTADLGGIATKKKRYVFLY